MGISAIRLAQLKRLIAQGREEAFYSWTEWQELRSEVLKLDRFECQNCKKAGRYRKARIVHHVKHLRDRPELALSVFDQEDGERQLVSLCKRCHEMEHPESQRQFRRVGAPLTAERWD